MTFPKLRLSRVSVSLILATSFAAAAIGGGIDDFKLTRAIPSDVFIAVHARSHPGQEFLKKQYARVWAALDAAELDKDVKKLLGKLAAQESPEAAEQFERHWQQVSKLLDGVEWSTLPEREFAYAMRLEFPTPQFVFLFVPPADKLKGDFDGLSAVLSAIVELAPQELSLTKDGEGDSLIHKLGFTNAPFPLGVTLARQKDVLMIGFGATMPEQVLSMLGGKGGSGLAATPRFSGAFKNLPAPKDELVFVDVNQLMTQIRAYMAAAKQQMGAGQGGGDANEKADESKPAVGGPPDEAAMAMALVGKLIDAFDMADYVAAVQSTDGMKSHSDSICVMKDSAKSSPLYAPLFNNKPIAEPLKFVPQAAGSVMVWNGLDFSALYSAILKFVSDNVPDGAAHVTEMKNHLTEAGVDVEKDYLSWIGGGITFFSVPGKTQYSPSEWAVMVSVKDEAKAKEMLGKGLDKLGELLAQQNGAVSDAEIEGGEGFRSITHPMLMFLQVARPTLGVVQGQIILGSSPKIITQSLAVAAGKDPGFAKSERFQKEGVAPKGPVTSLSFSDESKMGQELAGVLKMLPVLKNFPGVGEAFQDPAAGAILDIIGKLGPVVEKLDFMLSTSSVSTFDGKVAMQHSVSNYREPPPPPATSKPADGAAPDKTGASEKGDAGPGEKKPEKGGSGKP